MNTEDATEAWQNAQYDRCCSCHINPPCSFCEDGFSLSLDEYLELYVDENEADTTDPNDAWDRAMRGI